jgi:hypothetical protein
MAQHIPLLGIYPREMKTFSYTRTCLEMFMLTVFLIVLIWKEVKCSVGEWATQIRMSTNGGTLLSSKNKRMRDMFSIKGCQELWVKWINPDTMQCVQL